MDWPVLKMTPSPSSRAYLQKKSHNGLSAREFCLVRMSAPYLWFAKSVIQSDRTDMPDTMLGTMVLEKW